MATPDMTVSWLPRPATTPQYPQNLLRPSASGCSSCSSAAYGSSFTDSRRNMAGLASLAGLHGFGRLSGLEEVSPTMRGLVLTLSALSAGASAFHGYRRNRGSLGWAIGWGLLGGMFPVITPAVALAQGFGKPARR